MVRHSEKYIVITNYLDQSLKPGNEISTDHVYFPVVFFRLGTQDQRVILRAEICYDMICYAINLINKAVKWTYSAPIW